MQNSILLSKLSPRDISISLQHILDNSKAESGGDRDVNFLKYLLHNNLLIHTEAVLKRTNTGLPEEYYLDRYKKIQYETDRHFLCRTAIQDELKNLGIDTLSDITAGNMEILRSNSSYDIVASDFGTLIDIGLTPARNYFKGLTDLKVKNFMITSYFDEYMDDIIFSVFTRRTDKSFLDAVKDYIEGFKEYIPNVSDNFEGVTYQSSDEI